jgi:hypothetical protein
MVAASRAVFVRAAAIQILALRVDASSGENARRFSLDSHVKARPARLSQPGLRDGTRLQFLVRLLHFVGGLAAGPQYLESR